MPDRFSCISHHPTLSFHVVFIIFFRCHIYAFNFFTCVQYTVHASAPYNRVERTIALYNLYFTRRDTWWLSHSLSRSFPYAALTFPIRNLCSLSSLALSVMVLPRYTKLFVCTSTLSWTRMSTGVCAIFMFFTGWNSTQSFLYLFLNWTALQQIRTCQQAAACSLDYEPPAHCHQQKAVLLLSFVMFLFSFQSEHWIGSGYLHHPSCHQRQPLDCWQIKWKEGWRKNRSLLHSIRHCKLIGVVGSRCHWNLHATVEILWCSQTWQDTQIWWVPARGYLLTLCQRR